ncbi:MAG: Rrf2 family transcriptional regulator [Rikenellaceae bacterium]
MCIICCSEFIKGYNSGQKITATSLSEKFNLNIRTLNPSLNKMTHAGILRSQVGGVDRGYIFARDPKDISVYEIVAAVQDLGNLKNCKEAVDGASCFFSNCDSCKLYMTNNAIMNYARSLYNDLSIYDLFTCDKDRINELLG